jgi:electron transport complex protein RnfB
VGSLHEPGCDAAQGLIEIRNNLAIVDYASNRLAARDAIERCPTGAIVWLDEKRGTMKGAAARKILHQEPLPLRTQA